MIKSFLGAVFAGAMLVAAALPAAAQVYVQIGPPAPVYERVPVSPGAGYVWVGGYYRWNGTRYVWVPGHYVRHTGHWCGGHWKYTARKGWFWTNGRWC